MGSWEMYQGVSRDIRNSYEDIDNIVCTSQVALLKVALEVKRLFDWRSLTKLQAHSGRASRQLQLHLPHPLHLIAMSDPTKVAIAVPSKDPKAKKQEESDKEEGTSKKDDKKDEDKSEGEGDELVSLSHSEQSIYTKHLSQSEEDLQLRSELEMLVARLKVSHSTPC